MRAIDFHTHVFPDALAARAIPALEAEAAIKAKLDGRVSSLIASMDRAGIEKAVACSIATRPEQFDSILRFSRAIASERIIPFPSVHPADPLARERVRRVYDEGFLGIKLHPYYQDFDLNEDRAFPLYEVAEACGLIVVAHTGFDIAFPRVRRGDPLKVLAVLERFPALTLVTTHLGGWEDWDEVRRHLLGKPIYLELSFCGGFLGESEMRDMLLAHPSDRLLFGTDSPWTCQVEAMEAVAALRLGPELERLILRDNAARLLGAAKLGA